MKVLILGTDEFVGKNVYKKIKDNKKIKSIPLSKKLGVSLLDFSTLRDYLKKITPDVIINSEAHVGGIHYVSKYAADIFHDNVQMILNLYKAVKEASPHTKIINPMSNCSYPGDANIHKEKDWWKGEVHESVYAYGNAKRTVYVTSYCYKKQYGIKSINFLIPNFFGPEDETDPTKTHALGGMMIRMLQSHKQKLPEFEIWGTGKPIREWGFIEDIAEVLIQAISIKDDIATPVNIAQNKGYSIKKSAKLIAKTLGFKGKLVFNSDYQDGAPIKILDNKEFKKLFPNFKFTDHQKAIEKTVKYYKSVL